MSIKTVRLGAPYRWLGESVSLCRAHPRVLFGAASLLMLVALLPTLLQLLLEAALKPSITVMWVLQGVFTVIALVAFPPIVGGFYRITHALREGRSANALDLFAVFQDGVAARQLIVTNLVFVLLSIVLLLGLAYAFGGQDLIEFLRAMSALQPGARELPALPDGLLPLLSALMILAMVIMTAQGLATAQVAISGSLPFAAIGAGFGVALRNIGSFLLFYLPLAVLAFVMVLVTVLVATLVGMMLSVISPLLAAALFVPLSLLLVVLLYAVMFTFYYHAWRDTLCSEATIQPDHQLAA
jgi:hypothetical protein